MLYWKDPVQTGLICGLGCCVYLLYHVRGYSVLSLVSLVLLFNLAANATFILLCATPLKPMLLKDGEDSRDRLITLEHLVQSALESKQTSGLVQVASQAVEKAAASLRDDLACPSIIAGLRAFTSLSLMYVVGCLFSLETVLFIGFLALFSAPALYARNSSIVDAQMAKITAQINEQAETLVAKAYKSAPQLKTVADFVTKQRAGPKVKES